MTYQKKSFHLFNFAPAIFCFAALASVCFAQEIQSELAPTSKLTGIALPAKAERVTDQKALPEFLNQLNDLFAGGEKKPQKPEVIGWDKDKGYTPAAAANYIQQVNANLNKLGFKTEIRDVPEKDGITAKVVTASKVEQGDGDIVMGVWFITPDALFLAWAKTLVIPDPPSAAQGGKKLAGGDPALTTNFVNAFSDAMNRIFDVPNDVKTKAKLQQNLLSIWQSDDQDSMSNAVRFLMYDEQISQKGNDAPLARILMRTEFLKQAAASDANLILRQLKQFYDAAHPALAQGKAGAPALTQDAQQAYISMMALGLKEMPNGVGDLRDAERKWLADGIIEIYVQADAASQQDMAQLPFVWLVVQNRWTSGSDSERNELRQLFAQKLNDTAAEIKKARARDDANDAATTEVKRAGDELDRKLAARAAKPEDFEQVAQVADRTARLFQVNFPAVAKTYSNYAGQLRRQAADLRQVSVAVNSGSQDSSIQMYANIERQHEKNVAQAVAEADRLAKQNPSTGTYNPGAGFWSGIHNLSAATLNIGANMAGGTYVWR